MYSADSRPASAGLGWRRCRIPCARNTIKRRPARNPRVSIIVRKPAMSSVTQTYGANTAFIEELYERYRANPESVSTSWQEFFHDYEPRFEEEFEEELPLAAAGG